MQIEYCKKCKKIWRVTNRRKEMFIEYIEISRKQFDELKSAGKKLHVKQRIGHCDDRSIFTSKLPDEISNLFS